MDWSANLLSDLASVTARSLVWFAAAAAAMFVLRAKSAAARHAVWTVAAGGMLALAALAPVLPPLPVRVLKPVSVEVPRLPDTPLPEVASAAVPVAPAPIAKPRWGWKDAAAGVYLLVALLLLARLAFGYLFTRRLMRAATPIYDYEDVYQSAWISAPLTIGHKVLVPADWQSWTPEKLAAVLAHERAHVRRHDWAIVLTAGVNRCVFWFHPVAWWLERRLAALAEEACDDSALLLVEGRPYAQALLDMAAAVNTAQGRLVWEAMAMAKVAEVRKRIDRILDETRQIPRGLTRARWAALVVCSVPLVWLAAVTQLAPAIAQESPKTPAAMSEFLKGRRQLTQGDVAIMEQYLAANPHDLDTRSQLVTYYYLHGTREPRISHILWMVVNHPESSAAAYVSQGILPRESSFNTVVEYRRVYDAWKQAVAAHPNDPRVLANAAQFMLAVGDLPAAEGLLTTAATIQPADTQWKDRLGKLYALAILEGTGDPKFPTTTPDFTNRVRTQLQDSKDGWLLFSTGSALVNAAQRPQGGRALPDGVLNLDQHPLLEPAIEFGKQLLARSPENGGPRVTSFQYSTGGVIGGIVGGVPSTGPRSDVVGGVSGGVPGGVLGGIIGSVPSNGPAPPPPPPPPILKRVDPVYPPLAEQARISGVVYLRATISRDGTVANLEVVSGHPLLVPAALDAARQWRFQPQGSDVTAILTVPFAYSGSAGGAPSAPMGTLGGIISSRPAPVPAPPVIKKVDPVYPPLARQARIQGIVKLAATIGTDGTIRHIEVISGHPLLVPPTLEAVKQWTFQPPATEISTELDIPFTMSAAELAALPPPAAMGKTSVAPGPMRIRVGGNVQAARLISKVDPVYPPQARSERIEGNVTLTVTIGEDGLVQSAEPVDGNPILAAAAAEAVKQWKYQPTLLNNQPVTVNTTVVVPFQLN